VSALSLSTRRSPTPHYVQWMNQSGTLRITHKSRVKFSAGNYMDIIDCDVAAECLSFFVGSTIVV
jgi:hypothetical protein